VNLDASTSEEIIRDFGLVPLEGEGGYFAHAQTNPEGNSIYFLLTEDSFSSWHRLKERETWVFLAGDPIELHIYDHAYSKYFLERSASKMVRAVEPGEWMAARTMGRWSLILCYLAPAFSGMELAPLELVREWRVANPEIPELVHE
jgi:hypothetical protein